MLLFYLYHYFYFEQNILGLEASIRNIFSLTFVLIITMLYLTLPGGWKNTKSVMRTVRHQRHPVSRAHNTPLDCHNPKPFWISWSGGEFRVGSGLTVGTGSFLSYNSHSTWTVRAVAVSTGFGATGSWSFGKFSLSHYIAGGNAHACGRSESQCYLTPSRSGRYTPDRNGLRRLSLSSVQHFHVNTVRVEWN